jgi:prepilin-type N-terminal cleavage/methylation domain-containing protein
MNKIYNKNKGFTLIELLVVVAIIGILAAVGVVAYNGYTTSAKITATKQQHQTIKNFIKASYGLCALGNNYIVMKTCDNGSWSCKGLKVGSTPPGIVNRPCKYGAGSASNSSYHFAFHFNYSQMKNGWGLNGSTGSSVGGNMKDQCCMMRSGDPPLGRTHIWSSYPQSKIKVKTNIGDKDGNNSYVYDEIDWPYQGFKQ